MKQSWQIGGAFVGIIVGAGFASGQEIMQYFTSFGAYGIIGSIMATLMFMALGKTLARLGKELPTTSHKEVIYYIGGRYIGTILDVVITFFLFGVAVVMFAGAGATFEQMFNIPAMVGSIIMAVATVLTLLLNVEGIIKVIGMLTPYLMIIIFIVLGYALVTSDMSFNDQHTLAQTQKSAASHWIIGALLYVSYNIAAGIALLIVMGSTAKTKKIAGTGGMLGGLLLGVLIVLINLTLLMKIDVVAEEAMPTLALAKQIHPAVGILMAIALLGMMYNTAVGMIYSFTVRFVAPDYPYFKGIIVVIGMVGYGTSFVGFTQLVGNVYATMGYLGFALIIATFMAAYRHRKSTI